MSVYLSDNNGELNKVAGGLSNLKDTILDLVYPVNSIYMSVGDTEPGILFGGEWEKIKDTFLLCSGDSYSLGTTGGEATHILSTAEMPYHKHPVGQYQDNMSWFVYAGRADSNGRYGIQQDYVAAKISTADTELMWGLPQGSSAAHNNMPPYLVVNVWKRTN